MVNRPEQLEDWEKELLEIEKQKKGFRGERPFPTIMFNHRADGGHFEIMTKDKPQKIPYPMEFVILERYTQFMSITNEEVIENGKKKRKNKVLAKSTIAKAPKDCVFLLGDVDAYNTKRTGIGIYLIALKQGNEYTPAILSAKGIILSGLINASQKQKWPDFSTKYIIEGASKLEEANGFQLSSVRVVELPKEEKKQIYDLVKYHKVLDLMEEYVQEYNQAKAGTSTAETHTELQEPVESAVVVEEDEDDIPF